MLKQWYRATAWDNKIVPITVITVTAAAVILEGGKRQYKTSEGQFYRDDWAQAKQALIDYHAALTQATERQLESRKKLLEEARNITHA